MMKLSRVYQYRFILILLVWGLSAAASPLAEYRGAFDGVLDNREHGGDGALASQTFFFARGEMELGVRLDERHRVCGGVGYMQEFGARETADNLHLLLYYHYDGARTAQFRFGAFPRAGTLDLPEWFFGDEATYYRPFLHGAAAEIGTRGGGLRFNAWVDWTGRQSATVEEAFLFGYGAKLKLGTAFAKHDFIMYHLAHTKPATPDSYVQDNGGASAEAGITLGGKTFLDTLQLSAGGIISLDRDREDNEWHTPAGAFLSGEAAKSIFVIKTFLYKGTPQRLIWGDDFYSYSNLESLIRLDLGIRFNTKEYIKTELFQKIYFYNNKIGTSQYFQLNFSL